MYLLALMAGREWLLERKPIAPLASSAQLDLIKPGPDVLLVPTPSTAPTTVLHVPMSSPVMVLSRFKRLQLRLPWDSTHPEIFTFLSSFLLAGKEEILRSRSLAHLELTPMTREASALTAQSASYARSPRTSPSVAMKAWRPPLSENTPAFLVPSTNITIQRRMLAQQSLMVIKLCTLISQKRHVLLEPTQMLLQTLQTSASIAFHVITETSA